MFEVPIRMLRCDHDMLHNDHVTYHFCTALILLGNVLVSYDSQIHFLTSLRVHEDWDETSIGHVTCLNVSLLFG